MYNYITIVNYEDTIVNFLDFIFYIASQTSHINQQLLYIIYMIHI